MKQSTEESQSHGDLQAYQADSPESSPTGPKISVVMPVYKRPYTLAKTIQSILDQSFKDFEFIVVLDGPDEELQSIVESISDGRIKLVICPVNQGVTKALNVGLTHCRGQFFARMDNGDFADPDRLKLHLQSVIETGADVSFCHAAILDSDGTVVEQTKEEPWILRLWMSMFTQSLGTAGSALFVDCKLLKSLGGFDEHFRYAQDYEISERLAGLGKPFAYSDHLGLVIPMYEDGITKQKRAAQEGYAREIMARATRRYLPEITTLELGSLAVWRDRFRLEGETDPTLAIRVIRRLAHAFQRAHHLTSLPFEIAQDIARYTELNLRSLKGGNVLLGFLVLLWCAVAARSPRLLRYFFGCIARYLRRADVRDHPAW